MEATNIEEFKRQHVRKYIMVFVALLALTIVTVTVSSLHLGIAATIVAALIVATVKGSLVACYFMHLISERRMIYLMLLLTVVFFAALMSLPLFHYADGIILK